MAGAKLLIGLIIQRRVEFLFELVPNELTLFLAGIWPLGILLQHVIQELDPLVSLVFLFGLLVLWPQSLLPQALVGARPGLGLESGFDLFSG